MHEVEVAEAGSEGKEQLWGEVHKSVFAGSY